jgi:DNA processing protein
VSSNWNAFCFAGIPGVGPKTFHRVRARLSELGAGWGDIFDPSSTVSGELDLPGNVAGALHRPRNDEEEIWQRLEAGGIDVLVAGEEKYPALLLGTLGDSSPPLLYARGNLELLKSPGIGFSGARYATEEGVASAREMARVLSGHAPVVSGAAIGIDTAAHLGALEGEGGTVAIVPCGILRHRSSALAAEWDEERACVVSEFWPNRVWSARCAMQRNRTIVALSRAVICFEPGTTGGTRETAKITLSLGRSLFLMKHEGDVNWKPADYFESRGGKIVFASDIDAAVERVRAAFDEAPPIPPGQGELF